LLRDLRTSPGGLSAREAARRLVAYGPNELTRRSVRRWPRELAQQLTHPLAVLLAAAAMLAWASGTPRLTVAIIAVIVLNAAFAFVQEMQAMHGLFGTAALTPAQLATVAPFPFVVWGADELRRLAVRRRRPAPDGRGRPSSLPPETEVP
jgi:magnesium-transporting ATPase (P-type)